MSIPEYEETNGKHGLMDHANGRSETLDKIRTAGSVNMDSALFEKLYLSPPNQVKGELRRTFGNPTPLALVGFLVTLLPLCCALMGWRGGGNFGAAVIPVYFFMGGVMMFLSGLLEWVLGNSFPSTVFISFGCFFLAFGGILNPSFGAYGFYASADATSSAEGLTTRGFNATMGFWLLAMAILVTVYFICSLRTNMVFAYIFFSLIPAFTCLAGAFWLQADSYTGNASTVHDLFVAAGACLFTTSMAGWYILLSILLATVDFPIQLPVGDLSQVIKGGSERLMV